MYVQCKSAANGVPQFTACLKTNEENYVHNKPRSDISKLTLECYLVSGSALGQVTISGWFLGVKKYWFPRYDGNNDPTYETTLHKIVGLRTNNDLCVSLATLPHQSKSKYKMLDHGAKPLVDCEL